MKQIRKRLTYANVMSSIAVFLVLGGTAFAATQLGKNTVGSKQIKKNAVTTAKIKNNAVTTNKIKNGAITGAKVNLGSLGTVPNANHASTADTATKANSADSVGGSTLRRIFYKTNSTASKTVVLSLGGLTLTASCEGGEPALVATTSVDSSTIRAVTTNNGDETFYSENDTFDLGDNFNAIQSENDSSLTTLIYANPTGSVVTADIGAEEEDFDNADCGLFGNAIG